MSKDKDAEETRASALRALDNMRRELDSLAILLNKGRSEKKERVAKRAPEAIHWTFPGVRTFAFQDKLPRLPVPSLTQTIAKYKKSVQPLLKNDAEREATNKVCEDILKGEGAALYAKIQERAQRINSDPNATYPNQSWLENWWETYAYFSNRDPILVNSNFFGTMFEAKPHAVPLLRAAALIRGGGRFYTDLMRKEIGPDSLDAEGRAPMCMWQYNRLFASTRAPGLQCDEIVTYEGIKHVIIICKDQLYSLDIFLSDGTMLSIPEIVMQLEWIKHDAATNTLNPPICVLTTDDRTKWATARNEMLTNKVNSASLKTVESALFCLLLSDVSPDAASEVLTASAHNNTGLSIWADKSFTWIVFANGKAAFNGEHGHCDAPIPVRMNAGVEYNVRNEEISFDFDLKDMNRKDISKPIRLQWDITPSLHKAITSATIAITDLIHQTTFSCLSYNMFGNSFIKAVKISPDAFFQIILQLSHYRDQGEPTATYETATTRIFKHGRTETIRSCSPESFEFCQAMDSPAVSNVDKIKLFRKATDAHIKYLKDATYGKGVDRLLFGMRMMAYESGLKPHPFFLDPAYSRSTNFKLSTSNVSFRNSDYPGFGPPIKEAYGCCYNIQPNRINATISSNKTCSGKDATRFVDVVTRSLTDVCRLMGSGNNSL